MVGKNALLDLNPSDVLLLDFCACPMCTWHQDALGRIPMINFVVISSDLWLHVLDTWVKRGGELSTDHYLVDSWLC